MYSVKICKIQFVLYKSMDMQDLRSLGQAKKKKHPSLSSFFTQNWGGGQYFYYFLFVVWKYLLFIRSNCMILQWHRTFHSKMQAVQRNTAMHVIGVMRNDWGHMYATIARWYMLSVHCAAPPATQKHAKTKTGSTGGQGQ